VLPDGLVVGGGAVGAASAYYLARAGFRVTLLEPQGLASGASGANVGLVTLAAEPAKLELSRLGITLFQTLGDELDYQILYTQTGSLSFFETPEQQEEFLKQAELWRDAGIDCQILDGRQTRELEPVLAREILGSVWEESGGSVYPFALTMGFASAAARLGARIETGPGARVTALRMESGRVMGVETPSGFKPGGFVVLATGVGGNHLLDQAGLNSPITPVRGHVMVTEPAPPIIHRVIFGGTPSARQTAFGNIIIGSLQEHAGYNKQVELSTMRQFARGVLRLFPGVRGLHVIRSWTGLRPAAPDRLPLIGPVPGVDGLFLNLGHFHSGICFAPASGQILADLLRGAPVPPWAAAFDPARFSLTRTA
jgi:glycine/D-amino acid oxidase-like deaminating enzyme